HQQALHRVALCEVVVDLLQRGCLVAGERERQAGGEPALREGSLGIEGGSDGSALAARAPAQQRELDEQQLVEREPAAAALGVPLAAREVQRGQRGRTVGQPLPRAQVRRQWLRRVGDRAAVLLDEREDARRVDPLARGVLRDLRVGGGQQLRRRVRGD